MIDISTVIAIAAIAFISTNLDNLILLVALYSRYPQHTRLVAAGYICGMLLIGGICFVIGKGGEFIPITYLGLLGIIPISMGVFAFLQLFWARQSDDYNGIAIQGTRQAVFMGVLMTQLSNSADSIITFSVFLADSTNVTDYLITLTFLAMICLFAWTAYFSLSHRKLSEILHRYGRYVTPLILILVGAYILANTAGDLAAG